MELKKWLALALAGTMSFSMLTACGGGEEAPAPAEDDTAVEETAAPEKEAPAEEDDAAAEGEAIEVPVTIINGTGVDIAALYMTGSGLDEWGESAIPEGSVLPDGNYMDVTLLVDANNTSWDISIEDEEGTAIDFYDLDISEMPADGFGIELLFDGETATAAALADPSQLEGDYTAAGDEAAAEDEAVEEEPSEEAAGPVQIPVTLVNGTGVDIAALYLTGAGLDDWGENVIADGYVLPDGNYMDVTLLVDAENLAWDLMIEDQEGTAIEFYDLDISEMPADGFGIELLFDGETATATALADASQLEGDYTAAE